MNEVTVGSWEELNEQLYAESWHEELGRFRSTYVFRGISDASFTLNTSISRLGDPYDMLEAPLLRSFRKYAYHAHLDITPSDRADSLWHWLALAQHHGLPTRLLDWTYSPYVAAHFATADLESFDVDASIWCLDYSETNHLLPPKLKHILDKENTPVFTSQMLNRAATTLEEFDALGEAEFVVFLEPSSLDNRIVNQFALFSLMSSATGNLDEWLREHPQVFRRITIPAELKWEVRDKLDQANITERVLFPGLDGLSQWLKRYYTVRPGRSQEQSRRGI